MRKNIRYKNFYMYKRNRKNSIKRQLYLAMTVFVMSILIAVVTVMIAFSGIGGIDEKGSVSKEQHIKEGEVITKEAVKIDEKTMIRVLIKTSGFDDIFHGDVEVSSDLGLVITAEDASGDTSKNGKTVVAENEVVKMSDLGHLFDINSKIHIKTAKYDGAVFLPSVERSCGTPAYYGEFDIYKTGNGYVIVNELLLDKYIYGVVPSEMPESYGMEALKAQAVCARSYAARRLNALAFPEYEAAVDDSVRYQVYNNYEVTEAVKEAVDATAGELAMYNGEIIDAYFYASSCGVTAGGEVWSEESGNCPYLKTRKLDSENEYVDLSSEKDFSDYINNTDSDNFDFASSWYRWEIFLDLNKLSEEFQKEYGKFKEIKVNKRSSGGVITNLSFVCENKTLQLDREYDIREFLGKLISKGKNQSNDIGSKTNMLPSACFYVADTKDNIVTIKGGGYGHGVGMSQTGAKGMAQRGLDYKAILTSFYPEITIEKML